MGVGHLLGRATTADLLKAVQQQLAVECAKSRGHGIKRQTRVHEGVPVDNNEHFPALRPLD